MNYEDIKKLIDDMGNSKLTEISIDFPDGTKIDMSKNEEQVKVIENTSNREDYEIPKVEKKEEKTAGKIITSPMVGTFYMKPSPNSDPYVKVGQKVKKGDVLCIIEAMKLMNEIEAEFDGEIKEILVKDGEPVEYGTDLFIIE